MKPKHQRLLFISFSMAFLIAAVLMTLRAFDESLVYFYSPTEINGKKLGSSNQRLGGIVKVGSLKILSEDKVEFVITDGQTDIQTFYTGMLPSLFREGQGVVAEGGLNDMNQFAARTILAKHDENYMPKEVVDALKESGRWQEKSGNAR